ncbi:MAG TPA: carbamoyltransferase HypF, partial [Acidimicrobiales bacterium]|nr:carbamoyltransferase HypF [Acidimicrobiales bacterium]
MAIKRQVMRNVRLAVRVEGTVQGVGFRPFVYRLATELGLVGFVGNDTRGVFIEAQGDRAKLDAFLERLELEQPALASVRHIEVTELGVKEPGVKEPGVKEPPSTAPGAAVPGVTVPGVTVPGAPPLATFEVVASSGTDGDVRPDSTRVPVTADAATCDACLAELFDPGARRYRYPFVNCTNCGPRFTIVQTVPYDRANTTMSTFPLCDKCRQEYEDPANRRYHAEATCCPACGPRLTLLGRHGEPLAGPDEAIETVVQLLWEEKVVAIKGLGGYHLAALASSERAVSALRARKHREEKPFALMVPDIELAHMLCDLTPAETALLRSPQRPIVLSARRSPSSLAAATRARVAASVAPGSGRLGLMLPYTPLHHLLMRRAAEALVMTSANISDEPIAYRDAEALERLSDIADAFLVHDRPIHIRTDDSVTAVVAGRPTVLRRSRGYAPAPLELPLHAKRPVLACGGELKNTICLAEGRRAIVSQHIGDLENAETLAAFEEAIEHYVGLFKIRPEIVAHDLHPEYLST